jgi:hypothetical protein
VTRKDYVRLAAALQSAQPYSDNSGVLRHKCEAWKLTVLAVADALADDSGYDLNGNRRFDRERFLKAAGFEGR